MESNSRKKSIFNLVLAFLVGALFLIFPFWNGLFFPVSASASTIYVSVLALAGIVWVLVRKAEIKGLGMIDLLVALYTLVNLLTLFTAANMEFTLTGIAKQFAYFFFYLLVRVAMPTLLSARLVLGVVAISGGLFSLYGLLVLIGVIDHSGAMMRLEDGTERISSVFEYSNTFASYVAVCLLFGLALQADVKRWLSRLFWYIVNALSLTGIIFTYSRGAWLTFFAILVVMILLAKKGTRWSLSMQALMLLVATLPAVPLIIVAAQNDSLSKGILALGVWLLLSLVFALVSDRVSTRVSRVSISYKVLVPVLVAVLVVVPFAGIKLGLIPQSVVDRIASINLQAFSVQQRFVFYKDGLSALQDHPVIGAGDRTWEAAFYKYQSYPYYTTSSHSVIIDQLMNVGVLGALLFVAVVGLTVFAFWKQRKRAEADGSLMLAALFAGFLELVLHGAIDVDFTYATIGYLFWMIVALGASFKLVTVETITALNAWKWNPQNRWIGWLLLPLTVIVALFGSSYVFANHKIEQAKANLGAPGIALDYLDAAQSLAPYSSDAKWIAFTLEERYYDRTQDAVIKEHLQKMLVDLPKLSPENADWTYKVAQSLYKYDKPLEGTSLLKTTWENAPYRAEVAEQYMVFNTQIGEVLQSQQKDRAKGYFQETLNTYKQVESRIAGFKDLPSVLRLERPYDLSPSMKERAAVAALYLGQYDLANRLAADALKSPNANHDKLAAVRGVALEKMGQQDSALNDLLKQQNVKAQYEMMKKQL